MMILSISDHVTSSYDVTHWKFFKVDGSSSDDDTIFQTIDPTISSSDDDMAINSDSLAVCKVPQVP